MRDALFRSSLSWKDAKIGIEEAVEIAAVVDIEEAADSAAVVDIVEAADTAAVVDIEEVAGTAAVVDIEEAAFAAVSASLWVYRSFHRTEHCNPAVNRNLDKSTSAAYYQFLYIVFRYSLFLCNRIFKSAHHF